MVRAKPPGVDLLGIIVLINGLFAFFTGLDSLGFAAFLARVLPINTAVPGFVDATAQYFAIWGSIIFAIGVGSFIVAFGLWWQKLGMEWSPGTCRKPFISDA